MPKKLIQKLGTYTQKVADHFQNPRNYGRMKNPNAIGKVGNLICGDVQWLYIRVDKNKAGKEIIADISFETFGCVAALATSSVITELAKGKTLEQALKISKDEVVKSLGGLPAIKLHCSVLAADALSEAIYDYYAKKGRPIPAELAQQHRRVQKDKEVISERYSDWLALEEKMHNLNKG